MNKSEICTDFADEVCDILGIEPPSIRFVNPNKMQTATQLAALTPECILIRNDLDASPDLFFAIAHELRHAYQIANGESLKGYKASNEMSVERYNLQPLEVDANAFAAMAMTSLFGISPKFDNLPENVKKAIDVRKKQIMKDLQ